MSYRIELRPRARADLRDIGDYSDARWGNAQAQRYLEAIADSFDQISQMPLAGSDQGGIARPAKMAQRIAQYLLSRAR